MPHCIIEYSKLLEEKISVNDLIQAVYQGALASDLFGPNYIKVRALAFENYLCGGLDIDFVHVTLRILSGRDLAARNGLSTSVHNALRELGLSDISITVEVCEIERDSYCKKVG